MVAGTLLMYCTYRLRRHVHVAFFGSLILKSIDAEGEAQNGDEIIIFSVGAIFRIGAKSATLSSE